MGFNFLLRLRSATVIFCNPGLLAQKWAIYGVELPKRERERVLF